MSKMSMKNRKMMMLVSHSPPQGIFLGCDSVH